METNGVSSPYRHHNSPSTERFLSLFSQPENPSAGGTIAGAGDGASVVGDEFDEDEVFWTGDFSEPKQRSNRHRSTAIYQNQHHSTFLPPENSGVLAVLPEEGVKRASNDRSVLYRKTLFPPSSSSSSRMIPALPKSQFLHDREFSRPEQQAERFPHSAPVNVPVRPNARNVREEEVSEEEETEKEMLPPHEIVAKGAINSEMTFSVLEGVGRTLKGRDLRQVRNAVWRKTGFID